MVLREIKVLYKQTILGFTWAIIRPVFSMIIFSIIFGKLAKIPSDGIPYPIFSYAALVPWIYFSTAMTKSTGSLVGNAGIFTKVYFPRLIIPLTPVIAGLVDFLIALAIVLVLMAYYSIMPTMNIFWLPFLTFIMIITSAGIGMWLSALAIQYRDVRHAINFLSQLMMYAAPVVWPVSLLHEKLGESFSFWYGLYPMAGVIEGFRSALIGQNPMPWNLIFLGSITGFALFISGAFYFKRKERIFADVA
ncbi:MAG TPA: ABC transporter permease [Flavobacteriales bacterium]|nr:ABC transporter permease [Flavobacteriales bacterium]